MGQAASTPVLGDPRLIETSPAHHPCARFGPGVLSNGGPYTLIAFNISQDSTSIGDTLVLSSAVGNSGDANLRSLAVLVSSPFIRCFDSRAKTDSITDQ